MFIVALSVSLAVLCLMGLNNGIHDVSFLVVTLYKALLHTLFYLILKRYLWEIPVLKVEGTQFPKLYPTSHG
jgi:hypothetical protein